MSQICQERGGAFRMPQPPPHRVVIGNRKFGLHADEMGMVNLYGPTALPASPARPTAPVNQASALKPFGHHCPKCGVALDELDTCGRCHTDYSN